MSSKIFSLLIRKWYKAQNWKLTFCHCYYTNFILNLTNKQFPLFSHYQTLFVSKLKDIPTSFLPPPTDISEPNSTLFLWHWQSCGWKIATSSEAKTGFKISTWETWTPDDNSNEHIRHHHQHQHFNASDWVVCGESVKTRRISGRREMLLASSKKNLNFKPKDFDQTTFQSWWNLLVYCWKSNHREWFYILNWHTHNALYNVWQRLQDSKIPVLSQCKVWFFWDHRYV